MASLATQMCVYFNYLFHLASAAHVRTYKTVASVLSKIPQFGELKH